MASWRGVAPRQAPASAGALRARCAGTGSSPRRARGRRTRRRRSAARAASPRTSPGLPGSASSAHSSSLLPGIAGHDQIATSRSVSSSAISAVRQLGAARRVLGQRPRLHALDELVGAHHRRPRVRRAPRASAQLVEGRAAPRACAVGRRRRSARRAPRARAGSCERARAPTRSGGVAVEVLVHHASRVRLARLPRSFARWVLQCSTNCSSVNSPSRPVGIASSR